jgi:hypothetical protein
MNGDARDSLSFLLSAFVPHVSNLPLPLHLFYFYHAPYQSVLDFWGWKTSIHATTRPTGLHRQTLPSLHPRLRNLPPLLSSVLSTALLRDTKINHRRVIVTSSPNSTLIPPSSSLSTSPCASTVTSTPRLTNGDDLFFTNTPHQGRIPAKHEGLNDRTEHTHSPPHVLIRRHRSHTSIPAHTHRQPLWPFQIMKIQ